MPRITIDMHEPIVSAANAKGTRWISLQEGDWDIGAFLTFAQCRALAAQLLAITPDEATLKTEEAL